MVPSFFPVAILRPFLVVEHHFPRPHQKRGLDGAWGVSFTAMIFLKKKVCTHSTALDATTLCLGSDAHPHRRPPPTPPPTPWAAQHSTALP